MEVTGLTYALPDGRRVLNDVSFTLGEGVTAGLAGPNGAGRIALLRLIAGDLTPTSGKIASKGGIGYLSRSGDSSSAERDRLSLEALLQGPDGVLLLDGPDEHLDVRGKEWLEDRFRSSRKTILLTSRDRQLLANAASRIIAVEEREVWVHEGGYATFADARLARAPFGRENETFRPEASGSPRSVLRALRRVLRDDRTRTRAGERALTGRGLRLPGLTTAFDLTVRLGDRIAICGADGPAKSLFRRLLDESGRPDDAVPSFDGTVELGERVTPGSLTRDPADAGLAGRSVADLLTGLGHDDATAVLTRYGLEPARERRYEDLSDGERAGLNVLLLELAEVNLLLLDEPTGRLDPSGADTFQRCLRGFPGAVLAITGDRWLAGDFTRFLHFAADGQVREATWGPE
ncbi:ATP-binding cassette domain-containing protein [Nonomuraea sp. NPDC050790]|uniref:ATP-binding cassette domain-containing protein n=1 Tax=Nonomuraea sp. NPDC050790 TaxID=3364371 RepID=UPI0037ABADDB